MSHYIVYKQVVIVDKPEYGGAEWRKAHMGHLPLALAEEFKAKLDSTRGKPYNTKIVKVGDDPNVESRNIG